MWLARQLPIGAPYTILSVSFSSSPKPFSESQSSWCLPSPPIQILSESSLPSTASPPGPADASGAAGSGGKPTVAVQLRSKGAKTYQNNQNSDNKESGTLLKPYTTWTSLSLIFHTREIITEDSQEMGRFGKVYIQMLWINCALIDPVD